MFIKSVKSVRKGKGDWWEAFIEKVSFESGVELRWSDAQ